MTNTLFDRVWTFHDSYEQMEAGSLEMRNPDQALTLSDHYAPVRPSAMIFADMDARRMSASAAKFAAKRRMPHFECDCCSGIAITGERRLDATSQEFRL